MSRKFQLVSAAILIAILVIPFSINGESRYDSDLIRFDFVSFSSGEGIPQSKVLELDFDGFARDFGYYIVQFSVPLDNSVRERVLQAAKGTVYGARSFGFIPDNCLVFRLSKGKLDAVRALDEVRWIGEYEPQFRISEMLLDDPNPADDDGRIRIFVNVFKGDDLDGLIQRITAMGADLVESGSNDFHEYALFSVKPEMEREIALAAVQFEATEWVSRRMPKFPNNDWSRWINQSYNTSGMGSAGSGWYAQMSADVTRVPIHRHGIYGDGQIVGSSDTGLDYYSIYFCDNSPTAPPFIDYGTSTNWTSTVADNGHRKVRSYSKHTVSGNSSNYIDAWSGHGSHVNGSIGGNNEDHIPPNTTFDAGDGMAPLCRLVFSDLEGSSEGALYAPSDIANTLLKYAYNHGARLHSNSWGSRYSGSSAGTHPYNDESQNLDEFMWSNKDFLVFFSAGNSNRSNGFWYPPDGVNGEGLSKTTVTVGAAESGSGSGNETWTNPGSTIDNDPENCAIFSSHGPSSEGMRKPNLTACGGWYIFSADADDGGSLCHTGMEYMGGTSMSTPTTAGLAALVREYYMDGYYPGGSENSPDGFTPSAALTKATLLASCRNMTGEYTIDDFEDSGHQDVPSMGQGWGRVTLDDALYFDDSYASDVRDLEVHDISTGFSSTGTHSYTINCGTSTSESFKAVLSYSDYPSTPGSYSIVNNLNLEVVVGGSSYKGNVFASSGARSVTGGSYDALNPDEVVWLDGSTVAGQQVEVYVHCTSVPYGPQPYALVMVGDFSPNEPSLSYASHSLTELSGDGDAYPEKGESFRMPISLSNAAGAASATTVTGTLSESDAYITITDNTGNWPDISAGATAGSNFNHFSFTIADNDATCDHVAEFIIDWDCESGTYTGTDSFDITLGCPDPVLEYASNSIDDGTGGDGDTYPEPGETVVMHVTLNHTGGADADDISATLSESDAYITITDNAADWPDIDIGGSAESDADHFEFTIGGGCPNGHVVDFTLDWNCYCGSGSENFQVTIGGPRPELVYAPDPILTEISGDGDIYPEPGESFRMAIELYNDGTANATGISGRLSESDADITLDDGAASWPNIAIDDTASSQPDHFAFTVGSSAVCGHVVQFTLIDTANFDVVDTNTIEVTISSPDADLSYDSHVVNDAGGGDSDGYAEAGESFILEITLANSSVASAEDVSATISESDAYITITDNAADWPDIAPSGSESSLSDHFAVQVDPLAPYNHDATITINWDAYCGSGSDNFTLTIGDPSNSPPGIPGLDRPFPFERVGNGASSTTPALSWDIPSDSDGDHLNFETRFGVNRSMSGATTIDSRSDDAGFTPSTPVVSGIGSEQYVVGSQSEGSLTDGTTYWWESRAHDANQWGSYADERSFTVDVARSLSDWHQTTDEQFSTGTATDVEIASDKVHVSGMNIVFEDDFESYSSLADFEAEWTTNGTHYSWQTANYHSAGHAIRINDGVTNARSYFYHSFTDLTDGFIECWSMTQSTSDEQEVLRIYNSASERVGQIYYRSGYVAYWDGSGRTNMMAIDPGVWHHYRIEFDCATDQANVIIDGSSTFGPFDFIELSTALRFVMTGAYTNGNYTCDSYFDDYIVGQEGGAGSGTLVSEPVIFDWNDGLGAWDKVMWTQDAGDSIEVVVEQVVSGSWSPYDSATAASSASAGTLDISGLSAADSIRLRAKLEVNGTVEPDMYDWTVSWAPDVIGIEVRKGGPSGPLYNSAPWNIGQLGEGIEIVMATGDVAYIENTGTVPVDLSIKANTASWVLADVSGADSVVIMGLFASNSESPLTTEFVSPSDAIDGSYKPAGDGDSGAFGSSVSDGTDIAISAGRYLYIYFKSPDSNTQAAQQTITIYIQATGS